MRSKLIGVLALTTLVRGLALAQTDSAALRVEQQHGSEPYRAAIRRYLSGERLKIMNGKPAAPGSNPWQVSLGVAKIPSALYAHFCGGSVYSATIIITAAHCVRGNLPRDIVVTAGTVTLGAGGFPRGVKRIVAVGAETGPPYSEDIALLELVAPLPLDGARVSAIELPTAEEESAALQSGQDLTITGWGVTVEGGRPSRVLQFATLPFVGRDECNAPFALNSTVTANMLCAGSSDGGIDACYGDSGGGLTGVLGSRRRLIGIISWGEGCGQPEKYGVYSDVARYAHWIATCASDVVGCKKP